MVCGAPTPRPCVVRSCCDERRQLTHLLAQARLRLRPVIPQRPEAFHQRRKRLPGVLVPFALRLDDSIEIGVTAGRVASGLRGSRGAATRAAGHCRLADASHQRIEIDSHRRRLLVTCPLFIPPQRGDAHSAHAATPDFIQQPPEHLVRIEILRRQRA